jgi:hypothetical protein
MPHSRKAFAFFCIKTDYLTEFSHIFVAEFLGITYI